MTGNKEKQDDLKLVLLKTIVNRYEFDLVQDLLNQNKIPYTIRDHGSGGYMRIIGGMSIFRTDILVEENLYDKAMAIVGEILLED